MERDARYPLFYPDQLFKTAVREYQRQTRDAFNQAVRESSENYEVLLIKKLKVFRIDMGPKHEKLYAVKRTICYKNIKHSFGLEKEKRSSQEARCTRKCSPKSLVFDGSNKNEKFNNSTFPLVDDQEMKDHVSRQVQTEPTFLEHGTFTN